MKLGAKYIPFGPKVRLMLDIGAGGGSLGLLLKRKYDVQVLSTIFPDWPYW
jgi:tRNA1(Val) A37 N6-methylase TrmN6